MYKNSNKTQASLLVDQSTTMCVDSKYCADVSANTEIPMSPLHPLFVPYCQQASVIHAEGAQIPIRTLRDTGALQSVICQAAVPSSAVK